MSAAAGNAVPAAPAGWCDAVAGTDEAQHCAPPRAPLPAQPPRDGPALKLGVVLNVSADGGPHWKLLMGYPGWNKLWDGWIKPPAFNHFSPRYNGTLCVAAPCLFDVSDGADPHERNDVAASHPEIVAELRARIFSLLDSEVTVADSGLCPTSYGATPDPRGTAKAIETGFWEPWLAKEEL